MFETNYEIQKTSKMRNFVNDTMDEGRLKNIVYLFFEVDITNSRQLLYHYKERNESSITLTSYILRCFAKAIEENRIMNAYQKGRHQLIIFKEVDVAAMIEKEVEGVNQPIHYIIRNANHKSLLEINSELRWAKNATFDEMVPKIDRQFFSHAPDFLRRIFWWLTRKDPKVKKQYSGTVGLTSLGMMSSGSIFVQPITPMTSTLGIGGIVKRPVLNQGLLENHDFLCLTICADHRIVDGAPMMHFIESMKKFIEQGFEIPQFQDAGFTNNESKNKTILIEKI